AINASLSGYFLARCFITSERVRHEVMPWGMFQVAPITRPIAWLSPVPTLWTPAKDIHAAVWHARRGAISLGLSVERLRFWKRSLMDSSARVSTYGWCLGE